MIITDLLESNAKSYGEEIALVEIDSIKIEKMNECQNITSKDYKTTRREISWVQFNELSNKYANLLISKGAKKGTKIAILLTNCIEWLPIYFGILKAGCIAVPLNFRYPPEEVKYCVELAECEMIIFEDRFKEYASFIYNKINNLNVFLFLGDEHPDFAINLNDDIKHISSNTPEVIINDNDLAAIYFSSGTTGFPKAILHSHKGLMCAVTTEQKHHLQTKEDNFLCIPPLYHTGSKIHWFGSLLTGGKAVILRGTDPELILNTISEEKCTIVWLLVPWIQDLLDAIESKKINLERYNLSQWRLMHSGAQPIPPELIKKWLDIFPWQQYDTNYGLSETLGPGCVHLGIDNINKIGAIGKPGYLWETRIVDENGLDVPIGEIGELIVKGKSTMNCYFKDCLSSMKTLKKGWLHTGDMARMDEDGFIFLIDRKKDIVISGGENIYPVQVENELRNFAKVKDVAVIGVEDKRLGEIVVAIIEVKDNMECDLEEIENFCTTIPHYRRPKKIFFDKIPRNPTGKIEKNLLREKYQSY